MNTEPRKKERNIPTELLLQDIKRVADLVSEPYLMARVYNEHGKYSYRTAMDRLGGWAEACAAAGVLPFPQHRITEEEIAADFKRVAALLGKNPISKKDYAAHGNYDMSNLINRFGSWANALKIGGMQAALQGSAIPVEELFAELRRVWLEIGRRPTWEIMQSDISKYSAGPYARNFGSWAAAIEAFKEHVRADDDFKLP